MASVQATKHLTLDKQNPLDLRLFVTVSIGDVNYKALLDPGAQDNHISALVVPDLKKKSLIRKLPYLNHTIMPNGVVKKDESKVTTNLTMNELVIPITALVMEKLEYDLILGMPFLVEHKVIIHTHTRTVMWQPNTIETSEQNACTNIVHLPPSTTREVDVQPRTSSSQPGTNVEIRTPTNSLPTTNLRPPLKLVYQKSSPGTRRRAGRPRVRVRKENGKRAWICVDRLQHLTHPTAQRGRYSNGGQTFNWKQQ